MDPKPLLDRIRFHGDPSPTLEMLRRVQEDFLFAVPFENFDIHLGREITLDPEAIHRKIVDHRRGGFCYECNILFHDLLKSLEYRVDYVSARMVAADGKVGRNFGHMALLVHLDPVVLTDVGNGRSCREPLPFDETLSQETEGLTYRIGPHPDGEYALYFRSKDADWAPRYLFSATPRTREEFESMCRFHQTSPESLFTRHRLATLATTNGRITLLDTRLTVARMNGTVKEDRELPSNTACLEALQKVFGIDLPYYPPAKCPPPADPD